MILMAYEARKETTSELARLNVNCVWNGNQAKQ